MQKITTADIEILSDETTEVVMTADIVIYYVLYGKMEIVSEKSYYLEAEDFLLMNSKENHTYKTGRQGLCVRIIFSYQHMIQVTHNPTAVFRCCSMDGHSDKDEKFRGTLKKMLSVHMYRRAVDRIRMQQYFYDILLQLFGQYIAYEENREGEGSGQDDRINLILEYVYTNYKQQISLQELADRLFLSVPYLSKYMKQQMGTGFVEFVNSVRLNHAVEELMNTDHPLTRIAYDNGFSNLSSFNRVFKQEYGQTPSEYKKMHRQPAVADDELHTKENYYKMKEYFQLNPVRIEQNSKQSMTCKMKVSQAHPYVKNWNMFCSIASAEELMHSGVQNHILMMKKELGINRVGIWSLFTTELMVDMRSNMYNFSRIDDSLDFLIEQELSPVIELTQHPKELYSGSENALHYERRDFEITDITQYERFLTAFIKHCINRYGAEQVEQWEFEQGRDERIPDAGASICFLEMFRVSWQVIKKFLPSAKIGGGAVFLFDDCETFSYILSQWQGYPYKPDFISIWLFPYDLEENGVFKKFRISKDEQYILHKIQRAKQVMQKYGFEDTPLYVSRWNMSISCRNLLNESCYKGAYLVQTMIDCIDEAECMAYCGSSDLLYEYFDSVKLLNGGYGVISRDGLKKPAWYALKFMNQLGEKLIQKGRNYIVTSDNRNRYYIVCQNCGRLSMDYFFRQENEVSPEYENTEQELALEFLLEGVKRGAYRIKKYYLNQEVGGVFEEWIRLGFSDQVDKEEIEYLKAVSVPHQVSSKIYDVNGSLNIHTVLALNEIQFIRISYIEE